MFAHIQDWHKGQALEGNFTPEVEVKCFECSLHFPNRGALSEHLTQTHSYNMCPSCQLISKAEFDESHACFSRVVGVSGAVRYDCNRCPYQGFSHKASVNHQYSFHFAKKRFACDQCDYTCSARGVFERHKKLKHLKIAFKCDICGFGLESNTVLQRHRLTHFREVVHKCKIGDCTFETQNQYQIGVHRKQHFVFNPQKEYEGKFLCQHCPYKSEKKADLINHEKTHESIN